MSILVINSGSSSLKWKLFALPGLHLTASGLVEQIGKKQSRVQLTICTKNHQSEISAKPHDVADHRQAIELIMHQLIAAKLLQSTEQLVGIGHRVVHGGETFTRPTLIDNTVIDAIEQLIPLAPLHNPANLAGIRICRAHAPHIPQVAVFDTAFHQTIPEHAYLYALPHALYQQFKIRRYGFHGTSHSYVATKAAQYLERPLEKLNIISLHLGNGASAAAIDHGQCVDTSMGLTPLEGLIMGTRSGDLDPAILFYLAREADLKMEELDRILNKESGLKGICDENDMRTITQAAEQGDKPAKRAITMFCYRIKKYIGSYLASLGHADCLIFTGGIGENAAVVRQLCCQGLDQLDILLDEKKNKECHDRSRAINSSHSKVKILVIPTDEELEIARQTRKVIHAADNR